MKISFTLNGRDVAVNVDPSLRLVDLLHDSLSITSLHPSCYKGQCGNCAILFNGKLIYSCLMPAFAAEGSFIHTFEGISSSTGYGDIVEGLEETGSRPCSFCLASKVVIIQSILENTLAPTLEYIYEAFSGTYCPCTNFNKIAQGVRRAAEIRRERSIHG
jgi:aerobic-type carbon monoxide dehydrogenase small subunit (CoxS/CutS family)